MGTEDIGDGKQQTPGSLESQIINVDRSGDDFNGRGPIVESQGVAPKRLETAQVLQVFDAQAERSGEPKLGDKVTPFDVDAKPDVPKVVTVKGPNEAAAAPDARAVLPPNGTARGKEVVPKVVADGLPAESARKTDVPEKATGTTPGANDVKGLAPGIEVKADSVVPATAPDKTGAVTDNQPGPAQQTIDKGERVEKIGLPAASSLPFKSDTANQPPSLAETVPASTQGNLLARSVVPVEKVVEVPGVGKQPVGAVDRSRQAETVEPKPAPFINGANGGQLKSEAPNTGGIKSGASVEPHTEVVPSPNRLVPTAGVLPGGDLKAAVHEPAGAPEVATKKIVSNPVEGGKVSPLVNDGGRQAEIPAPIGGTKIPPRVSEGATEKPQPVSDGPKVVPPKIGDSKVPTAGQNDGVKQPGDGAKTGGPKPLQPNAGDQSQGQAPGAKPDGGKPPFTTGDKTQGQAPANSDGTKSPGLSPADKATSGSKSDGIKAPTSSGDKAPGLAPGAKPDGIKTPLTAADKTPGQTAGTKSDGVKAPFAPGDRNPAQAGPKSDVRAPFTAGEKIQGQTIGPKSDGVKAPLIGAGERTQGQVSGSKIDGAKTPFQVGDKAQSPGARAPESIDGKGKIGGAKSTDTKSGAVADGLKNDSGNGGRDSKINSPLTGFKGDTRAPFGERPDPRTGKEKPQVDPGSHTEAGKTVKGQRETEIGTRTPVQRGDTRVSADPGFRPEKTGKAENAIGDKQGARPFSETGGTKKSPDGKLPDGKAANAKTPEAKIADAKTAEVKTPEVKMPDAKTPEAKMPDAKTADVKTPAKSPSSDAGKQIQGVEKEPAGVKGSGGSGAGRTETGGTTRGVEANAATNKGNGKEPVAKIGDAAKIPESPTGKMGEGNRIPTGARGEGLSGSKGDTTRTTDGIKSGASDRIPNRNIKDNPGIKNAGADTISSKQTGQKSPLGSTFIVGLADWIKGKKSEAVKAQSSLEPTKIESSKSVTQPSKLPGLPLDRALPSVAKAQPETRATASGARGVESPVQKAVEQPMATSRSAEPSPNRTFEAKEGSVKQPPKSADVSKQITIKLDGNLQRSETPTLKDNRAVEPTLTLTVARRFSNIIELTVPTKAVEMARHLPAMEPEASKFDVGRRELGATLRGEKLSLPVEPAATRTFAKHQPDGQTAKTVPQADAAALSASDTARGGTERTDSLMPKSRKDQVSKQELSPDMVPHSIRDVFRKFQLSLPKRSFSPEITDSGNYIAQRGQSSQRLQAFISSGQHKALRDPSESSSSDTRKFIPLFEDDVEEEESEEEFENEVQQNQADVTFAKQAAVGHHGQHETVRKMYIVQAGDTPLSIAVVQLNDQLLENLIIEINEPVFQKRYDTVQGRHVLVLPVGAMILLPNAQDVETFRARVV